MELDFEVNLLVAIIVVISTVSQALFGVGILIWGTPVLMLLNYSFTQALGILLPISLFISCFQFAPYIKELDFILLGKFIKFSIPGLIIGLLIAVSLQLDLSIVVASMLLIALFMRRESTSTLLKHLVGKYDGFLIFFIGIVHGVSNLGGSLLVVRASLEKYSKNQYRTIVSAIYFIFAFSQLTILLIENGTLMVSVNYIFISSGVYFIANSVILPKINTKLFDGLINTLILMMAVFLFAKSFT
jgi:hypothetical protein